MSALYTFAVVDSHPPLRFDVSARLRVVTAAGLSAVVEPADVAEYEGERLERNLADRGWLESAVRHHEGVIEELLDGRAVVPMRFGSIFSTEAGLVAMLDEHAARFSQLLDSVRGRREWGVRLLADRDALVRRLAPAATAATTGSDYLRRRRAEMQAGDEVSAMAAALSQEVTAELAALAEHHVLLHPRQADPGTLVTASFLIPVADEGRFLARAEELDAAHDGLSLVVTGPWPAYSFTAADVGGPA